MQQAETPRVIPPPPAAERDPGKERSEGQDAGVDLHNGARLLLRQRGEQAIDLFNGVVVGEAGADDARLAGDTEAVE